MYNSRMDEVVEPALYLVPVSLGASLLERVVTPYNRKIVLNIRRFVVEDRKSAVRFLLGLDKKMNIDACSFSELSEHTKKSDVAQMLLPLERREAVALMSEAGCPAVGDPGSLLVSLAHKKGLRVVPLAGANSMVMALMASGFNGQSFAFNGYLPIDSKALSSKLRFYESRVYKEDQTQIFIETPYRNARLFAAILKTCKDTTLLCVAAGLTTNDETIAVKSIAQWKKSPAPPFEKIPAIFLLYK